MQTAICVNITRNSNRTVNHYTLKYNDNSTEWLTPQQLKQSIQNKEIKVLNMQLTSSGRLTLKSLSESDETLLKIWNIVNNAKNEESNINQSLEDINFLIERQFN